MSKITNNTCIYTGSLYFTLEKISKEVMYHLICVNYEAKILAGAGTGPKWRLRLQPNTPAPGGSGSETLGWTTASAY